MAKFKKGDVVYGASDWFGGSYIPDVYTITKVNVSIVNGEEVVTYNVKGRRTPKKENCLYATEEEAQVVLTDGMRQDIITSVCKLKESLEKDNIQIGSQLLLGEERTATSGFKFNIGDVVYGHLNYAPYAYEPEKFIIKERLVVTYHGKKMNAYRVKRHGQVEVLEECLYDNIVDAKKAEVRRFMHETKVRFNALSERAQKLGIEAQVRPILTGIVNNLRLE